MGPSHTFDALGYRFALEVENAPLAAYLEDLLDALRSGGPADHRFQVRSSGTGAELVLDDKQLTSRPDAEELVDTLVHLINRKALEACDLLALHAGAVEQNGLGVVLPAEMESGKTTLTTGLVEAGFGYLTDEAVAFDDEGVIRPYPKPLSIDRGAWDLFPHLEPRAALATNGYKLLQWQVPPQAIRPDPLGRPCSAGVIVFPRYQEGADTVLEPLSRAEGLIELAKNTFRFDEQSREYLDRLAGLVRPLPCYRLTMGDLEPAVALVAGLLDGEASVIA